MLGIAAVAIGACVDDDADGGSKRGGSINVAMVDNPNMQDLAPHAVALHGEEPHQDELHDPRRGHLA